jgi:hypothetical protein
MINIHLLLLEISDQVNFEDFSEIYFYVTVIVSSGSD